MKISILIVVFVSMFLMLTLTVIAVRATLVGDIDGDGKVDVVDLGLVLRAYGTDNTGSFGGTLGDWHVWNPTADFGQPYGTIGLSDLVYVGINIGNGVTSLSPQGSSPKPHVSLSSNKAKDTYRDVMIRNVAGLSMFQFIVEWDNTKLESFSATYTTTGLESVGAEYLLSKQIAPNKLLVAAALAAPGSLSVGPQDVALATITFSWIPGAKGTTTITFSSNLYNTDNPYGASAAIPHSDVDNSKVTP